MIAATGDSVVSFDYPILHRKRNSSGTAAHESGGVCGVGESVRSSKETLGDTAPEEALGPVLSGLNWKLGFPLGDMGTGDPAIINHFLDSDTLSRGFHHAVSSSFFDFSCALV